MDHMHESALMDEIVAGPDRKPRAYLTVAVTEPELRALSTIAKERHLPGVIPLLRWLIAQAIVDHYLGKDRHDQRR